jgi:hypothetical protein
MDKDTDNQERRKRIKELKYNRDYERGITEEIPEYLRREGARERKMRRDSDVGTRREKTGIGRKERKEGA